MAAIVLVPVLLTESVTREARPQQRRRPPGVKSALEDLMQGQLESPATQFGAMTSIVRVDVIVTDRGGTFVADLSVDDFRVYEDEVAQDIVSVQLVDLGEQQVVSLPNSGEFANDQRHDALPGDEAVGPPMPSATDADQLGAIVFLIDAPGLGQQARARFGDAWNSLLDQTDSLTAPRAAYLINNLGGVDELVRLTRDKEELQEAAEAVRKAPVFGDSVKRELLEIANDLATPEISADPDVARQLAAAKVRTFERAQRSRALTTYDVLTSFADAFWGRSGRTAVVWVSTGIKTMQGGPHTALLSLAPSMTSVAGEYNTDTTDAALARMQFDLSSPDAAITAAQTRLYRAANSANVSFYSVDPSLLTETRNVGVDVEAQRALASALLATGVVENSLDGLRDSMRAAAAETGGRAFIQATDVEAALKMVEADTGRFYLVSYEPPRTEPDDNYHEIRVEVSRDDLTVRARRGYVDVSPEERIRRLLAAALTLPGSVTDLPVEVQVFRSRGTANRTNALLAVAVEGSELGLAVEADGQLQVSLDVHAVVLSDDGVVDESHERVDSRSGLDLRVETSEPRSTIPTLLGYWGHQHEWLLDPGEYTVNVVVLDNNTARAGASSVDIEIPAVDEGWNVSDPVLVAIGDSGIPRAVVHGHIAENQSLAVYVEVYAGRVPIVSGQVLAETDVGAQRPQGASLFPTALRPTGDNTHSGSLAVPAGMPPGDYYLQLQITDKPLGQFKILRLPISIVGPPGG